MAFRQTYDAILEMITHTVLSIPVARAILRRAGFWPPEVGGGVLPPGGVQGDYFRYLARFFGDNEEGAFDWLPLDASYARGSDSGDITDPATRYTHFPRGVAPVNLRVGPRMVLRIGNLRNPNEAPPNFNRYDHDFYPESWSRVFMLPPLWDPEGPGASTMPSHPPLGMPEKDIKAWMSDPAPHLVTSGGSTFWQPGYYYARRTHEFAPAPEVTSYARYDVKQYLIWESIPQGTWYFPFNVPWWVRKVDLGGSVRSLCPIQINVGACLVEGGVPAELVVRYSTSSNHGPWIDLAACDLSGGGLVRSEWEAVPDGAKGDVFLGLFLRARAPIAKLHVIYAESRVRWDLPEDYWQPVYDWVL